MSAELLGAIGTFITAVIGAVSAFVVNLRKQRNEARQEADDAALEYKRLELKLAQSQAALEEQKRLNEQAVTQQYKDIIKTLSVQYERQSAVVAEVRAELDQFRASEKKLLDELDKTRRELRLYRGKLQEVIQLLHGVKSGHIPAEDLPNMDLPDVEEID